MKFLVDKTYSEYTSESANDGDFSDNGFIFENAVYTLEELKYEIKTGGFWREKGTDWFETEYSMIDWSIGLERAYGLHIKLINGD